MSNKTALGDWIGQISQVHDQICALPNGVEHEALNKCLQGFSALFIPAVQAGSVPRHVVQTVAVYIRHIRAISQEVLEVHSVLNEARQDLLHQTSNMLRSSLSDRPYAISAFDVDHSSDLSYEPWRQWFIRHLSHPYPDTEERTALLSQIPSLTMHKLQTWFTNTRRRSGWSELSKRYADSKKENMVALLARIEDPLQRGEVDEGARQAVERVREYFRESEKRKEVADWLDEVDANHKSRVMAHAKAVEAGEVVHTPTRKLSGSSTSSSIGDSPYASSVDLQSSPSTSTNSSPVMPSKAVTPSTPTRASTRRASAPRTKASAGTKRKRSSAEVKAKEESVEPSIPSSPTLDPIFMERPVKKLKPSLYDTPNVPLSLPLPISPNDIPVFPQFDMSM